MSTRLLEIVARADDLDRLKSALEENEIHEMWIDEIQDDLVMLQIPMAAGRTEEVTDALTQRFGGEGEFRMLLLPVEAVLPRPETEEAEADDQTEESPKRTLLLGRQVSRDELYQDISNAISAWPMFLTMTVLSSVVAALGLAKNDVAVIIGAMVIAPLLGPNIGLALATTLGDLKLGGRTLRINCAGLALAVLVPAAIALLMTIDPSVEELHRRTQVDTMDVIIALAAGVAGSLAFTTGVSAAFIGVMVAVALLPPAAACGLLIGEAEWRLASGAGLLLAINIICVNLASVVTFLIQGLRPAKWAEKERAKRASAIAISLWVIGLIALIGLMLLARAHGFFDVEFAAPLGTAGYTLP